MDKDITQEKIENTDSIQSRFTSNGVGVLKINIPRQILLLTALVAVLIGARILIFGNSSLIYILWNILLAFIPFFISSFLLRHSRENKLPKFLLIIGGILWLLFIPNAPYLITDLMHVGVIYTVPVLYDVFLLFGAAWVGILLAMHSIFHIENMIRKRYSNRSTNIIISLIILFISFGIYLGRFLRFNSWDIIVNTSEVFKNSWNILFKSGGNSHVFLYVILFFSFILVSYYSWRPRMTK